MKNLVISGNTLVEWDIDDILDVRRNKYDVERIMIYEHDEKIRRNEFYKESYLQLEANKRI